MKIIFLNVFHVMSVCLWSVYIPTLNLLFTFSNLGYFIIKILSSDKTDRKYDNNLIFFIL